VPEVDRIYFIAIYRKDQKVDLTAADKKQFARIVREIREEGKKLTLKRKGTGHV
jgi:hypothetical protein